jgi:D-alanyl-D-alanine carboxypeptidase (penicillin-binding protein 5/6)
MLKPVIQLQKLSSKGTPADAGIRSTTSALGILVLLGLFTMVFGSTLLLVQASGGGVFAQENKQTNQTASLSGAIEIVDTIPDEAVPVDVILYKDPFENMQIVGKAAYVFDVASGNVLYEKNKNEQLPLASVTKVMTALVAEEFGDPDDVVTITPDDLTTEGSSGFFPGEQWKLHDLLDFTLITSSNDGASALASTVGASYVSSDPQVDETPKEAFVRKMNDMAAVVGMQQTVYNNETGLDISNVLSGGEGSAHDVALLYQYVLENHPEIFDATRRNSLSIFSLSNTLYTGDNTNEFVNSFPGLLGSKTGYTDLAGGNLAVVFDSGLGTPIIVVVLGSTVEGRFYDVIKLSHAALDAVSQGVLE